MRQAVKPAKAAKAAKQGETSAKPLKAAKPPKRSAKANVVFVLGEHDHHPATELRYYWYVHYGRKRVLVV